MSGYLSEVAEQPAVLVRTTQSILADLPQIDRWKAALQEGSIDRIIFTGMGASFSGLYPTLIHLNQQGIDAIAFETSELIYYYMPVLNERTLLVPISQSGRSIETLRLLDKLPENIPTMGITNDLESPLAQRTNSRLYINAGAEKTVSSKTYTSTVAALALLSCALTDTPVGPVAADIEQTAGHIERLLPLWREQVAYVVSRIIGLPSISYLARGASRASAETGALITKESAKMATEAMNSAQFRHGPIEMVDAQFAGFVFAGDEQTRSLNLGLAADLAAKGGKVTVIGDPDQAVPDTFNFDMPVTGTWGLPIAEIIPVQLLAAELAAQRGFEIGAFRYIGKVTTSE